MREGWQVVSLVDFELFDYDYELIDCDWVAVNFCRESD